VIIATCEARTSTVVAPIRLALMRSGAAPIARSWLATMYHGGIFRQAGSLGDGSPSAAIAAGALGRRHHGGGAAVDVTVR
jgi:hypothetical protein